MKLVPFLSDSRWGFAGIDGSIVIDCQYNEVWPFNEGRARLRQDNRFGFIDEQGHVVIEPKWDIADDFKEGLARVVKNERWGLIDPEGRVMLVCEFVSISDFENGIAILYDGKLFGFYNCEGELIIPLIYEEVSVFYDDIALVSKNGKWGAINRKGVELIPCQFTELFPPCEGLLRFCQTIQSEESTHEPEVMQIEDFYGFYSTDGICKITAGFTDAADFSGGLARAQWTEIVGNKKITKNGYINKEGLKVLELDYLELSDFSDRMAAISSLDNDDRLRWGFINTSGTEAVPCIFDWVYPFSLGRAIVIDNGCYGVINTRNEWIIQANYQKMIHLPSGFFAAFDGTLWHFISLQGRVLTDNGFESFDDFNNGYAPICRQGLWGLIEIHGQLVIPCMYEEIQPFSEGVAGAKLNGKWGYINEKNKWVIPPQFDNVGFFQDNIARVMRQDHWVYIHINGVSYFRDD